MWSRRWRASGDRKGLPGLITHGKRIFSGYLLSVCRNLSPGTSLNGQYRKDFQWISLIRLPEFVTRDEFEWAVSEAEEKKEMDFSKVEFLTYEEGLCVQCMHIGPYDNEPETIRSMELYAGQQGYEPDFESGRYHHEIYLSDVRRCKPENLKTVIRHPVRSRDAVR